MCFRQFLAAAAQAIIWMLVFAIVAETAGASSVSEKTIYSFLGFPDGSGPNGGLVADSTGNLYGTTLVGGAGKYLGTVFELSPPSNAGGAWVETILYSFKGGAFDGARPYGTLTFDSSGNLYGTTQAGGPNSFGTVFELSPPATTGASWTEKVIWMFSASGLEGDWPFGTLVFDKGGNLYGTTYSGGSDPTCDCGTVFVLHPPQALSGAWSEEVVHSFGLLPSDGFRPGRGLVLRGNSIYGTTEVGGSTNHGVVFRLNHSLGKWTEEVLYNFDESWSATGGLIIDAAGNLYGMTLYGGDQSCQCGTVYEVSPPALPGGTWHGTILYRFQGRADGAFPFGRLWRNKVGDLFGTTAQGGVKKLKSGVVFRLKPPGVTGGVWTLIVLHDFTGPASGDGRFPLGELSERNGVFYGTTDAGGISNQGAIFTLVLPQGNPTVTLE